MDDTTVRALAEGRDSGALVWACLATVIVGSACYGAVFGLWRSPVQAAYSAFKMPGLILAVTLGSAAINSMLAQVLGSGLSLRQVCACILLSLAIASALLGALSPVMLFLVLQVPPQDSPQAMTVYRLLLVGHTAAIGLSGIVGNVRLYQLLVALTGSRTISIRVLTAWIMVSGLAGCELSWVASPFLAKPGIPVPLWNPDAFNGNFFEYLWRAMGELA